MTPLEQEYKTQLRKALRLQSGMLRSIVEKHEAGSLTDSDWRSARELINAYDGRLRRIEERIEKAKGEQA